LILNRSKIEISENLRFSCALFLEAELSLLADLNCQLARTFQLEQKPEQPKASCED
jgi:hypothetical protein